MGKIEDLSINLNKPDAIYFPGEKLSGFVRIRIKERLKINNVNMNIVGFAKVRW